MRNIFMSYSAPLTLLRIRVIMIWNGFDIGNYPRIISTIPIVHIENSTETTNNETSDIQDTLSRNDMRTYSYSFWI